MRGVSKALAAVTFWVCASACGSSTAESGTPSASGAGAGSGGAAMAGAGGATMTDAGSPTGVGGVDTGRTDAGSPEVDAAQFDAPADRVDAAESGVSGGSGGAGGASGSDCIVGGTGGVGGGTPCVQVYVRGQGFDAWEGKRVVVTPDLDPFGGRVTPGNDSIARGAFKVSYYRIGPGPGNIALPDVDVYVDADANGSCSAPEVRWTIAGFANGVCGRCEEVKVSPAGAVGATATPCP